MPASDIASYLSLALAVVFWVLSTIQANDAKKTLSEIKTAIIDWQTQLNKATINIISSKPEIIAKETAMAEAASMSEFSSQLTKLIGEMALTKPGGDNEYQMQVLNALLDHHKNLILGKQQLINQFIANQKVNQSEKTETKQN